MGGGLSSKITTRYRQRLESLLSVDEAVNSIVSKLAVEGILNETYIVFTSDNGYMQGQHRLHQGKFVAYDAVGEGAADDPRPGDHRRDGVAASSSRTSTS